MWFKQNLPTDVDVLTVDDIRVLIGRYLCRFKTGSKADEKELENCSISMSVDMTNEFLKREAHEFSSMGLSVPDLTSKPNLEKLRNWNGEADKMMSISMALVKKT
ncbi:unnamed protein product [Mesocestoides corti]|uniref:Skp1_POZ domain-containing protein n=1 Tax=Mesocestoides corti TaxID=53468 RepID=A0A0R3UKL9_MESCO|nr:unnamed protein product [Mesocestoides corti]